MSGAFELVAGSFAVVGVADVVVRVGCEVSRFLADIADAPNEIAHLRECIDETTLLARVSRKLLKQLGSTATTFNPGAQLSSALGALSRELQSLKFLSERYKGSKKAWTGVKYTLDQRRISKAVRNLERAKSGLSSGLTLACRELSGAEHLTIQSLLEQCAQEIRSKTNALAQDTQNLERALTSKLDDCQQTLVSLERLQLDTLCDHDRLLRLSVVNLENVALMRKEQLKAHRTASEDRQKTRELIAQTYTNLECKLSSKVKELQVSLSRTSPVSARSNREIYFVGERRDMIMVYLLPLKDHLVSALDYLLLHNDEQLSLRHILRLQAEFERLVSSAAQEEAARHLLSTATSLDQWIDCQRPGAGPKGYISFNSTEQTNVPEVQRKKGPLWRRLYARRRSQSNLKTATVKSKVGVFVISVPSSGGNVKNASGVDEVRLSFMPSATAETVAINARFLQFTDHEKQPKLYTQLCAFNVIDVARHDNRYRQLFQKGSVEDVDTALRESAISPYHVSVCGVNLCIYYAARFGRLEFFQYFDSQGVGILNLHGDYSALLGFSRGLSVTYLGAPDVSLDPFTNLLEYIKEQIPIPAFILSGLLLRVSAPDPDDESLDDHLKAKSLLKKWMHYLKTEGYNLEDEDETGRTPLLGALVQVGYPSPIFIRLLLEFGANANATDPEGRNAIQLAMYSKSLLTSTSLVSWSEMTEEKLCLLIEVGADIHHRDKRGWTPSQDARYYDCWSEWCRALERNGKHVKEVLEADGELWLLGDNENWESALEEKNKEGAMPV